MMKSSSSSSDGARRAAALQGLLLRASDIFAESGPTSAHERPDFECSQIAGLGVAIYLPGRKTAEFRDCFGTDENVVG
jgi:hypothetical protein